MFDVILAKYFKYEEEDAIVNLLISARYIFHNSKNEEMLDKILELSDIELSAPLFLKHLDSLVKKESKPSKDRYFHKLKRSPPKLQKYTITWLYYSLFWALELDYNDNEEENNTYPYKISQIVLYYHYYYLRYIDEESKTFNKFEDKQGESFFETIAQSLTRTIEYLARFSLYESDYFQDIYFDNTIQDWGMNFLQIISTHNMENNYFFIVKGQDNYLLYENKFEDIKVQVDVSRKVNLGKSNNSYKDEDGIERNQKIVEYFKKGLVEYKKLVGLVWKKASGSNNNTRSNYNRQYTEEEPFWDKAYHEEKEIEGQEILAYEEEVESTLREKIKYRVLPDKADNTKIQNAHNQHKQNRAFSASVTKQSLLLSSYYSVPIKEHLASFLKFICVAPIKDNFYRHDFYLIVFIMSLLIGRSYEQVVELFYDEDKDFILDMEDQIIKIKMDHTLFASDNKINRNFLEKSSKTISYSVPQKFIMLIRKMKHNIHQDSKIDRSTLICEENKKKYKKYIRSKINSFDKKIPMSLSGMWRIIDTYKKEELKEDMSNLFCIGKYQTKDRARLAYASTHKNGQIHSVFIEKLYLDLGLHELMHILNNDTIEIYSPQIKFDFKKHYVGSSRAVNEESSKQFFTLLKKYINEEEDSERSFNLISVYTKFALSMLLGTRTFNESTSLKDISFFMHVLTISEKATTLLSGIRVVPMCYRAEEIIKAYQNYCKQMDVPADNIYLLEKGKALLYKQDKAKRMIEQITKDSYLVDFIDMVPVNTGRHVISKLAMETNFNGYYLEAFLGHYSSGAEQFGIFSSLKSEDYISKCRELTQKVAILYGVKVV